MRFALLFGFACLAAATVFAETPLSLNLRSRTAHGTVVQKPEAWLPSRTALIVCDMWDLHHCRNAVIREAEMAPRLNEVIEKARSQGVLIIHAPSGCMAAYADTPARQRALSAPQSPQLPEGIGEWCRQLPAEETATYPLDQSDGGEDDDPAEHAAWVAELEKRGKNPKAPWTRQIDMLRIDQAKDVISDSGVEIWNVLEERRIDRVILAGVHANMCVAGRPFGLRQMAKNGKRVVLMRDMTDTMYNPARWPYVSHIQGTELFVRHVERLICPTISSDQLVGGAPFEFSPATRGPKRLQILLLGDSTTEAGIPKKVAPFEPQLEDMLRMRLATEGGLPGCDVHNAGQSGEFIRRLLDKRYDQAVKNQPQADYIFIRYGLNDRAKVPDFATVFPKDFRELVGRLRQDHPQAELVAMTCIPYHASNQHEEINQVIRQIAAAEKLPLFDIAPRYLAELTKSPDGLCYRRYPLEKVPESLRPLAAPLVLPGNETHIVVMDNRMDGIFGHLPGWTSDRHPNLAGYNVIADETAKWLAPRIRERHPLPR